MTIIQHVPESAVEHAAEHAPKLTAAAMAAVNAYDGVYSARQIDSLTNSEEAVKGSELPGLSIGAIASSFKKLNSRSRVLWQLQFQIARLLSWQQPAFTLSVLCCYTLICLNPFLLSALPLAGIILGILVPGFEQRHPRTVHLVPLDKPEKPEFDEMGDYTPDLVPSNSKLTKQDKDFIMVLRQLQSSLSNAVEALEKLDDFVYGVGGFVDERYSSALYIMLSLLLPVVVYLASFIPVTSFIIINGWSVVLLCHPGIKKKATEVKEKYLQAEPDYFGMALHHIENKDIVLDAVPEKRQVEIFELQRQGLTPRSWESWVYTPVVYMINSPYRISEKRPPGTRFLDDISAPKGWHFDPLECWTIDSDNKAWIRYRGIKDVEIDIEHHWAYDYKDGKRGEWRRRRWTRNVYRDAADPLQRPQS